MTGLMKRRSSRSATMETILVLTALYGALTDTGSLSSQFFNNDIQFNSRIDIDLAAQFPLCSHRQFRFPAASRQSLNSTMLLKFLHNGEYSWSWDIQTLRYVAISLSFVMEANNLSFEISAELLCLHHHGTIDWLTGHVTFCIMLVILEISR